MGLSPRVRGNPRLDAHLLRGGRSIPACAGEPGTLTATGTPTGVYPRVCGGTGLDEEPDYVRQGLSPRVRGNRYPHRLERYNRRSIPACAGEPVPPDAPLPSWKVYPRVCGGTAVVTASDSV